MLGINVVLENTPTRSRVSTMNVTHLPAGFTRSGHTFNTERKDLLLVVLYAGVGLCLSVDVILNIYLCASDVGKIIYDNLGLRMIILFL